MKIMTFQDIDTLFEVLIKEEYMCQHESKNYKLNKDIYKLVSNLLHKKTDRNVKYPIWGWCMNDDSKYLGEYLMSRLELTNVNDIFMTYILDIPDTEIIITDFFNLEKSLKNNYFVLNKLDDKGIIDISNICEKDKILQASFQSIKMENIVEAYVTSYSKNIGIIKDIEQII